MELLHSVGGFVGPVVGYVVPFLFVLSIVVFFHEFGHFILGRLCGVKVLAFSIGFGPEIYGRYDSHGTRWRLGAIPLGGYVKFFGDANAASMPDVEKNALMTPEERRVSFFHKAVWQRALIIAAGPFANFVLAILIFGGVFSIYGKQIVAPRVDQVEAGSPAAKAGFQPGDVIVSVDGEGISSFWDFQRIVGMSPGQTLTVVVKRQDAPVTLVATPEMHDQPDGFGRIAQIGRLGIQSSPKPEDVKVERYDPATALWMGTKETYYIIDNTVEFLSGLVRGKQSADQLGGPIHIAQISEKVADSGGFVGLILLAATLSVSIGLLNLFPIPLLDGGHLVFYAFEVLRGRPLAERSQEMLFRVGMALVLMLMLFVTWNDLSHVFAG